MRTLRQTGAEEAFSALLAHAGVELPDRMAAAVPIGRLHGWAGLPGHLRQCWGPGWALVGDAGYFKDPITSHGITDALRDAELLSDALVDSMSGLLPAPESFGRYQVTRDRLSGRFFAATEAVAAYDWNSDTVGDLVREVSAAMGDEVELLQRHCGRGVAPAQACREGISPVQQTPGRALTCHDPSRPDR